MICQKKTWNQKTIWQMFKQHSDNSEKRYKKENVTTQSLTKSFPENVGQKIILVTSRDMYTIKFDNTF